MTTRYIAGSLYRRAYISGKWFGHGTAIQWTATIIIVFAARNRNKNKKGENYR